MAARGLDASMAHKATAAAQAPEGAHRPTPRRGRDALTEFP